ncbi:TetR/AcrR family transcriptional regulator [Blastomonas sp.]|uniref:TetR/AcrR family transcriptional regulator n=1 Tax=Blastomonas sp. TaxID=1909299 RepID=UPI00391A854F
MQNEATSGIRNADETRARILDAAQAVFSESGYSQAGMREIAARAQVATSLLTKYYQTKAKLFEQALIAALIPPHVFQADRSRFGEAIIDSIVNPGVRMAAPTMLALSLGDAEAREIAARVTREHILEPMAAWLPEPNMARATSVLMMTTGFAILHQNLPLNHGAEVQSDIAQMLASALQALVCETSPSSE